MKTPVAALAALLCLATSAKDVPTACFTFDDGFEEHYTLVAPILEKYGFRGTFNIITDRIGTEYDSELGRRKFMSWDQVRDLVKRGHAIETHTLMHPDLADLSRRGNTNEIARQIVASADRIEKETGVRPTLLCHPYCQKDLVVDRITYEAGLVPMGTRRRNFGEGTVANTPTGAGAFIREQAAKGYRLVDLLTHGVTAEGHAWKPYAKVSDFEDHVREVKAMVDSGEARVALYRDVAKTGRVWPGHERGMGLGGWLTNYKRFNVLPEKWRFPITLGDLEHFDSYITEKDVAYIASCGFDHVRLGFDQIVMEEKPYVYRERTFKLIDNFLDWCAKYGLNVVLNLHKAVGNYCDSQKDQAGLMDNPELQKRFVALWSEFERRYADRPDVAFELLNEVVGIEFEKWNALAQKTLDAIRAKNRDRWVVIGSVGGNYGCFLKGLKDFHDERVVYTFHNYEPGFFTHQRGVLQASNLYYNRTLEYPCADVERCRGYYRLLGEKIPKEWQNAKAFDFGWLKGSFRDARVWSLANPDKILWFGEFGTIRHAPAASRVNYMRDCVQIAEEYGFPYSVWNYCSTPNDGNRFSLVDDDSRQFLSADLKAACLGRRKQTGIRADVSALGSADGALLADVLLSRAGERTALSTNGAVLAVSYAIDPSLAGETYRVTVKDGAATVSAGRLRGLLYGTGTLLRAIDWHDESFFVPNFDRTVTPAKPFRCAYWARHFYNWYHVSSAAELIRYAQDLALWGINTVNFQYVYPVIDLRYAKPGDVERFEKTSRTVAGALARMDLDFVGKGGGNQAPHDTDPALRGVPNTDPKRGNSGFNVCPAKAGGLDFLVRQQREALAKYEGVRLPWLFHWPFDEGGCDCESCRPWGGNGFLGLCSKLAAENAKAHPESKAILSTWTFHDDEFAKLYDYLARPESRWIAALLVDSHTDFPKYPLTHKLPRDLPIVTFPEISMWGREPWGGFGAIAMPDRFERLFRQCEKTVSGFMYYSEGLFEEINKAVVTQLYVDPTRRWRDIVRDYCRYEFPGMDAERFVELVTCLESTQVLPNFEKRNNDIYNVGRGDIPQFDDFEGRCRLCLAEAIRAERLSAELERALGPACRASWRWRQIRLRTVIDREIFAARSWNTPAANAAYRELIGLYHAERTYGTIRPPVGESR